MQSNPIAEQWILKHVASDKIIDLLEQFPDEPDRVLSAGFLQELLANSAEVEVHRRGVQIANAIITEPINLEQAEIPYETQLIEANLEGANLADADLRRADMRNANLQDANLAGVWYNSNTRWPEGFDPEEAGAVFQY